MTATAAAAPGYRAARRLIRRRAARRRPGSLMILDNDTGVITKIKLGGRR